MYERILITGSRDFSDWDLMKRALEYTKSKSAPDALLIHGDARGADTLAKIVWRELGMWALPYPAEWHLYGKAAGHIRNQDMVSSGPDICLAFPVGKSTGTRDCMERARKAGIQVINVTEDY